MAVPIEKRISNLEIKDKCTYGSIKEISTTDPPPGTCGLLRFSSTSVQFSPFAPHEPGHEFTLYLAWFETHGGLTRLKEPEECKKRFSMSHGSLYVDLRNARPVSFERV